MDFEGGEVGQGLYFGAEVIDGILEKETEEGCGEAFTLEHAINNFKGLEIIRNRGTLQAYEE